MNVIKEKNGIDESNTKEKANNILIDKLNNDESYINFKKKLISNRINNLSTTGLTDSAKAMFVYTVTKDLEKSSAVVCKNIFEVNKFIQDLKFFCTDMEIIFMPSRDIEYYNIEAESKEIEAERAYALQRILGKKKNIVVTTIDSLLLNMKNRKSFEKIGIKLSVGENIDLDSLTLDLVSLRI